jgi:hypothetical protein
MTLRLAGPLELMKFRFTYDGQLRGINRGSRPDDQWRIRRHLHPQLEELWQKHPALKGLGLWVPMSLAVAGVDYRALRGHPKSDD